MQLRFTWRLLALLAVLVYVLLAFIVVLLLLHNIAVGALFVVTAVILVYAGWLLFVGRGWRSYMGAMLGVFGAALLVAELGYLFTQRVNRRAVLLVGIFSVLYWLLVGLLRRKYWAELRRKGTTAGRAAHFKNPYLIINPKAGNGRAIKAHVDTLARAKGVHVVTTRKGDDIEQLAREAALAGADVLGISGGDGTIGAVAKVAIEQHLPLVVLPGGTRCHFARDLGLDPRRIADALAGFDGVERRVDAATINGRIFLNNASFGLYADIVDHPDYRNHKMRVARSVVRAIANGEKDLYDLRFSHGKLRAKKALQVLVSVNRYATFNIFTLGNRGRLDEGVLQVTVVRQASREVVRRLTRAMVDGRADSGKGLPEFYQWVRKKFQITSGKKKLVVGVDGERETFAVPVKVRILPGALRVYVPAEGVRGRPKTALRPLVLRRAAHMF